MCKSEIQLLFISNSQGRDILTAENISYSSVYIFCIPFISIRGCCDDELKNQSVSSHEKFRPPYCCHNSTLVIYFPSIQMKPLPIVIETEAAVANIIFPLNPIASAAG
jgi:hypothetical protein